MEVSYKGCKGDDTSYKRSHFIEAILSNTNLVNYYEKAL